MTYKMKGGSSPMKHLFGNSPAKQRTYEYERVGYVPGSYRVKPKDDKLAKKVRPKKLKKVLGELTEEDKKMLNEKLKSKKTPKDIKEGQVGK